MKLIINVTDGSEVTRELTKAEKDQQKSDEAAFAPILAAEEAEIAARASAKAKLASLGLTSAELDALGFKDYTDET